MNRFKIILWGLAFLILLGGVIYGAMKLYYGWIVPSVWNIGQLGPAPLVGLAVAGGILAFFSPCPISVFPAYVGLFLSSEGTKEPSSKRALFFGLSAMSGILLFYVLVGLFLSIAGTAAGRYVLQLKLYVVIFIAILGLLLLGNVRLPTGFFDRTCAALGVCVRESSSKLMASFLYGVLYAVGGAACFLPVLLAIAMLPVLTGNVVLGIVAFIAYGGALGGMLIFSTMLIERGRGNILQPIIRRSALLKRVAGALLLLAAAAMGWVYVILGM